MLNSVLILVSHCEPSTKAETVKLALEKLKEAKMRKVKGNELAAFPAVDH